MAARHAAGVSSWRSARSRRPGATRTSTSTSWRTSGRATRPSFGSPTSPASGFGSCSAGRWSGGTTPCRGRWPTTTRGASASSVPLERPTDKSPSHDRHGHGAFFYRAVGGLELDPSRVRRFLQRGPGSVVAAAVVADAVSWTVSPIQCSSGGATDGSRRCRAGATGRLARSVTAGGYVQTVTGRPIPQVRLARPPRSPVNRTARGSRKSGSRRSLERSRVVWCRGASREVPDNPRRPAVRRGRPRGRPPWWSR